MNRLVTFSFGFKKVLFTKMLASSLGHRIFCKMSHFSNHISQIVSFRIQTGGLTLSLNSLEDAELTIGVIIELFYGFFSLMIVITWHQGK